MKIAEHSETGRFRFLENWAAAAGSKDQSSIEVALSSSDRKLGVLIDIVVGKIGCRRFKSSPAASHFDALCRSIVYQQLSKKAAATIYERLISVLGGDPSPHRVLNTTTADMKYAGLSTPKVRYLKELAKAATNETVDLDHIDELTDDQIIEVLTQVPGVGVWTAQMFLMFRLGRPDVLPLNDVGIQRGLQLAHGLKQPAAPGYVKRVGRRWAPYRSIACLYLWAAVDIGFSASG